MSAPEKNLTHRVRAEVTITSMLQFVAMALDLVFTAILSRLLAPADYGVLAAAMIFIALCALFREIGIGSTVVQLPNLTLADKRTGTTLVVMMATGIFLFAQLFAGLFADFMNMPAAEGALRVLSIIIVVQAFATVAEAMLLRDLKTRKVMMIELINKALAFGFVGVGMALMGFGYWALVWATVAETVLRTIALQAVARPDLRPMLEPASVKRLLSTGLGFTSSRIINFVALRADVTIVGRFLDAGSLGLYSRAYKLMSLPTDLYSRVADRVVFPAMAKVQNEPERLRSAYLRGIELTALFGLPITVVLYLLAPAIVELLLGSQWIGAIPIFSVLALGTYLRLSARVSGSLLRATGSLGHLVIAQLFYAVMTITGCLFAVRFGLTAVGVAVAIAIAAWFCLITAQACLVCGLSFRKLAVAHGAPVILALLVGLVALGATTLSSAMNWPSVLSLALTASLLGLLGTALLILKPRALLGSAGVELAGHLQSTVMARINLRAKQHHAPR